MARLVRVVPVMLDNVNFIAAAHSRGMAAEELFSSILEEYSKEEVEELEMYVLGPDDAIQYRNLEHIENDEQQVLWLHDGLGWQVSKVMSYMDSEGKVYVRDAKEWRGIHAKRA